MEVAGIRPVCLNVCKTLADDATVIRDATRDDVNAITEIWHQGWRDAHLGLVPDDLARLRTRENFHARASALLAQTRVAQKDDVIGFCICKADELYQMYVARAGRGFGIAQLLMTDAENRFVGAGVNEAWLACAIGNKRAMRFYENSGWTSTGAQTVELDTSAGSFELEVLKYVKRFRL